MAVFGIGVDSIEEKVKHKLIYDAQKQKKSDAKKKSKEKSDKLIKNAQWKVVKALYEQKRDKLVKDISDIMMLHWQEWNKKKRELVQEKRTPEEINELKKQSDETFESQLPYVIKYFGTTDINNFIEKAQELKPKFAEKLNYDQQCQLIMTLATQDFAKRVEIQMELAKKLAKLKAGAQIKQFDADKISQELANIPLKIEDTIDKIKGLFDTLLGKTIAPALQPDSPEFDLNAIMAQIKVFLNPVIASTAPLTAVIGKIPILGDIASMMQMMSSGSGNQQVDKAQLKKLVPKKPQLDPQLWNKLEGLSSDVIAFCITLPTLMIQIIFSMIDVIYSKLKIITSVIPLGGMFPLSLLPAAIDATPKILALIKVLPGMMKDCVEGLIRDKLAEAMALSFPQPNIDMDSMNALADDINEQNAERARKAKAEKKKTYGDVTKEVYENQLSAHGYTMMQAKTIQKNYKSIFNGNDNPPDEITEFVDNGKDQNLPNSTLNSFKNSGITMANGALATIGETANAATSLASSGVSMGVLNAHTDLDTNPEFSESQIDESNMEAGFDTSKIKRTKPSVEDYEAYINKLIAESDLSVSLNYQRLKPTENVVGELYETYRKQLEKYGHDVVLKDKMKPARVTQKTK